MLALRVGHVEVELSVDRTSPVPVYFQIAGQIADAIERGDLTPGQRLDNEITIARQLGLARPTVRQAIQHLVDKGFLVRRRGVGTQVVHGQIKRPMRLTSLHDDLVRAGKHPTTRVRSLRDADPPPEAAKALGVGPGDRVVEIERVRFADGEPLGLLHNWLPAGLVELTMPDLEARGLYQLLRGSGIQLRVASQRIGSRGATRAEAELLDERPGASLLTVTRTTYDDSGRAVEHGCDMYRGTLYSMEITVVDR